MSNFAFTEKKIEDISEKELRSIKSFAKSMATRKGKPHLADDFSSFVLEHLVRKGTVVYNLHWLWSSFCRTEIGNARTKKGQIERQNSGKMVPIEKVLGLVDEKPLPGAKIENRELFRKFQMQSRVVAVLASKWGFTGEEIAEVLGVTEARVTQIVQKIKEEGYAGFVSR